MMCDDIDNEICKMRPHQSEKYQEMRIYLFSDLLVWVSSSDQFKGSYSLNDGDVCVFI